MTKNLIYYYYYENDVCVVYDSHPYRGSTINNPAFKGEPYGVLLNRYSKLTGKTMMHSTDKTMDNWKDP